jgi:uncharacterized protein (TIGR03435 family)
MRYLSPLQFIKSAVVLEMVLFFVVGSPAQSLMRFDVASVKLNTSGSTSMKFPVPSGGRLTATNIPLKALIAFAYGGQNTAPDWTNSQRFDVDARTAGANVTREEYRRMLQILLEDRFKLQIHHETRDLRLSSMPALTRSWMLATF